MNVTNWKKLGLGIVTASATLLLAACGGGQGETESGNTDTNEENEANTEEVGGSLEVSVGSDYVDFINDKAAEFEEEYGVEVEVSEREMFETLEALPLDGPAGLSPDVTIAPYDRIGGLGQQGHLHTVSLPDNDQYDETDEQQVTVDDEIYGSPYVIEALIMYYNTDLLDKAPETFEELEALSEDDDYAYESESGKNTVFLANWVDFYSSYGLLSGFDGYVFGEDGTDTSDIGLNTEGSIEGIEYAADWYSKWPEGMLDATSAGDFVDDTFINGDAAVIIGGPWTAASYDAEGLNYTAAPIPTLPNGNEYEPFGGGKGWVISNYTENAENAQLWLDFITSEDSSLALHEFNNEVPANQQARQSIVDADENPLAIAVVKQYNNAVPMPNIPEMAEVWEGAETMMFDAVSGNKTPEESANDSVQIISDNIEQKY